ncbi:mannosyl-3-phosphoglycerate phosphatase [Neiella marina]|uniref:Mannosyl-3-phosphoglycerate phosphatase n=1 Tax=Neiella marina TaxID=508461 RepID=A0A8J2U4T2_9GAMM|nr:HAD-IIB family hydrolase [Neiella marina]GGA75778.1 mannosyl-3-phosphoglycerate phosphatase [Neiella marina]
MIGQPLIFTDLDGTLLDHFSYSFEPAQPLLSYFDEQQIPVIANTSKTCAELIHIRKELNNSAPFIVENGAAVYLPKKLFPECPKDCHDDGALWRYEMSRPREHWLNLLHSLKPSFQSLYTSFSNLSIEQLVQLTGLTTEQAERAAKRQFGEPVLWHGNREDKLLFIQAINELGGNVLQGGRFLHVGDAVNKGAAMQWLKQLYCDHYPNTEFQSIALGDSQNDVDMLEIADHAVVIASPTHSAPKLKRQANLNHSKAYGPEGWRETLIQLLEIPAQALLEREK